MIAQRHAFFAREYRFESNPLSLISPLINNYLAFSVSLRDLVREYAKKCPIQSREWRIIEMAFNDGTNVGEITIPVCRGFVEFDNRS